MITKLHFSQELESHYVYNDGKSYIDKSNRLNILIGPNNSGKSRFLREIFSERNLKIEDSELDFKKMHDELSMMLSEINMELDSLRYEDISGPNIPSLKGSLQKYINDIESVYMRDFDRLLKELTAFWSWLKKFQTINTTLKTNIHSTGTSLERITNIVKSIVDKHSHSLDLLFPSTYQSYSDAIYIPILRGLRPTQLNNDNKFDETEDNYCKRTIRDYFKGSSIKDNEIFTGLRLYEDTKKMLLGSREERNKIRQFEIFLSVTFFNNQELTLIPNIDDDSLHVSIGSEEWPIYKLGDGIQSIIILLYPLFFSRGKKVLVFIEEPENSMHPGLQRLFIETIMHERFSSFQYYITTHSNHFLDITLDFSNISVYTFKKITQELNGDAKYIIENSSNEDVSILDLIGAVNSSVFLSNCTIWVEGITDRLYIKKYLEIYQRHLQEKYKNKKQYREDYNFSFIEYSGGNLTHWIFNNDGVSEKIRANRISSKIFLVADKDSTELLPKSKKAERLSLLKEVLGNKIEVLNGVEIENLLKPSVLIEAIQMLEKDNFSNVQFDHAKILATNFLNKPIGKFIESNFSNLKRKYQAKSGTISCKLDFCRAAIDNIHTIDDISKEAFALVKKIYDFIASANQNLTM
jgi:predicted ATP-dependent endonuclease of OLD family